MATKADKLARALLPVRQALQGASFGFADEAQDALATAIAGTFTDMSYSDAWKLARELSQKDIAQDWEEAPVTSFASQAVGGIPLGFTRAGQSATNWIRGGSALQGVGKGAAVGAGLGGVAGLGGAGDTMGERAAGFGLGASLGGVLGGATAPLSRLGGGADNVDFRKVTKKTAAGFDNKAQKELARQLSARPDLPDQLARAEGMSQAAQRAGINLTLPEMIAQSGSDPLLAQQAVLGSNPMTAGRMAQMYAARSGTPTQTGQIEQSLMRLAQGLDPNVGSYDEAARALIGQADEAQRGITKGLVAKASPLYDDAYANNIKTVKPFADGVTITDAPQIKRGGKYLESIDINANGKKVGNIAFSTENAGTNNKTIVIKRSDVSESGKGIGTEAYKQFIDKKLAEGYTIKSDADVSKSAQRVYEKLKNVGYDVVEDKDSMVVFDYKKTTVPREERIAQSKLWPTEYKNGVRDVKDGYANLVGRPVYTIGGKAENLPKEIQQAIDSARKIFPSELEGLPDNSVKVLDYAKRILDDDIETAQRAGQRNFARSRAEIKNNLLSMIDEQVPSYAQARGIYSGNPEALQMRESIGALADIDPMNARGVNRALFGGTQQNAEMAAQALGERAPTAAAARIYGAMDELRNDPVNIASRIAPDQRTSDMLRTYAPNAPIDETLSVINQAKLGERMRYGSPTQPRMQAEEGLQQAAGGALNAAVDVKTGGITAIVRKAAQMLGRGSEQTDPQFYADMADLVLTDQGMDLLRRVAMGQQNAIQELQSVGLPSLVMQRANQATGGFPIGTAAIGGMVAPTQQQSPVFLPQDQGLPQGFVIQNRPMQELPAGFIIQGAQ